MRFATKMNRHREMKYPALPVAVENLSLHNDNEQETCTTASTRRQHASSLSSTSSSAAAAAAEEELPHEAIRPSSSLVPLQQQQQHLPHLRTRCFDREGIELGKVVGRGSFGVVRGIRSLPSSSGQHRDDALEGGSVHSLATTTTAASEGSSSDKKRKHRQRHCHRYTYVLKEIERPPPAIPGTTTEHSERAYQRALLDFTVEAKFMSELTHPNIVKLRGTTTTTTSSEGNPSLGLVMEYLPETLTRRLGDWSQQDRATKGITGFVTRSRCKASQLFQTRLFVARDIALALQYLHSRSIIFRDLKPDNLGISVNNVVKLFDFGLAKTLSERERDADGLYRNMTQFTGAARYMAPEVATSDRYNLAADVYSWTMLLWYILALEPPFGLLPPEVMMQRVFAQGHRPYIYEKWPSLVQKLLRSGWAQEVTKRPAIDGVVKVLQDIVGEGDSV